MNSPLTRPCIAIASLVTILLFVVPLAGQVKVTTPGSSFSVVSGRPATNNAGNGRRFRGEERANIRIKAPLPLPSGVNVNQSQPQKLGRLVVRFQGRQQGPSIRLVQLFDGANLKYKFQTNLRGDYSTRETVYSSGSQYANVWVFNPPIAIGSQFSITLDITFPGGIDSRIPPEDLDFTVASVETDFPDIAPTRMGKPKSAAGERITPTSIWPNGKAYFFRGPEYVRFDPKLGKVDPGYPQPIAGHWPGFPPEFEKGVDALVVWDSTTAYFFKGSQYLRYDIAADKVLSGYPQPISAHWPGLWTDDIDAGVVSPNGKAYFFKGNQYIRYDLAADKADDGPRLIKETWRGFPLRFTSGVDCAVMWNNGKAYFFKGDQYIRYDVAADKVDGDALPIAGQWPGLWPWEPAKFPRVCDN